MTQACPSSRVSFFLLMLAARIEAVFRMILRRPWQLLVIGLLVSLIGLGGAIAGFYVRAFSHLRAGRADLERHHNAEALTHLQAYLRAWPDDSEALLLSARACWRLRQFDEAEHYLQKHQQAGGPRDDFVREFALIMAAQGAIDKAAEYCMPLLERKDAAAALALEALVSGCTRQYRLAEAAAFLQRWLEIRPDDTQALLYQCHFDHMRGQLEEAVPRYYHVLQLDPEHYSARHQLAATLVELRRFLEALSHLEMLQQCQAANAQSLVLLARCWDSLGRQAEAEQLLDQVLTKAPHDAAALAARGQLALRRGQLADAEAWLGHALVHEPANRQARYQLAQCLLQQGKMDEAQQQEQRLKQLEADEKRFYLIVTKEMSQRPQDPALRHELGLIFLRSGEVEEGLRWLHEALRLDPTSVPLNQTLAEYYQLTGDMERATYHRQLVSLQTNGSVPNAPSPGGGSQR
jgi:predicted Zn-dependent protease